MIKDRVVIDLVPIRPGKGGTGSGIWTHARELLLNMDVVLTPSDPEIHCLINPEQKEFFKGLVHIKIHVFPDLKGSNILRLFWIHLILPIVCMNLRAKALHKLATETPLFLTSRRITTVHDFFNEFIQERTETRPGLAGRYFNFISKVCFRKSRSVITVSEAIRDEALHRFPNTRAMVSAVHNGVDAPGPLKGRSEADHPFTVLCVAKFMPYKGQMESVLAFDQMLKDHPEAKGKVRLIMHGFNNDEVYFRSLHQRIKQGAIDGSVIIRPYGKKMTIEEIYQGADLFLFLSQYEGFGLPLIESQALGIPVLCSNIPVLREVGGTSARYVDRDDPKAIAEAIYQLYSDPYQRETLRKAGSVNVGRFTWNKMAKDTLDVYRSTCA